MEQPRAATELGPAVLSGGMRPPSAATRADAPGPARGEDGIGVSVAMIVKDEQANLPGALSSLADLDGAVDEVCVYDTGSTDGTQDLARSAGAHVHQGHWDGDFARARNAALDLCEHPWVVVLDADERVVSTDPTALTRALGILPTEDADALEVTVEDIGLDGQVVNSWESVRIFDMRRCHYVGAVHEDVRRRDGGRPHILTLPADALVIRHHGYADAAVMAHKMRRNHALADDQLGRSRAAGDHDGIARALVDRARSSIGLGDHDAAIDDYAQLVNVPGGGLYRLWGLEQYADLLLQKGRAAEAAPIVDLIAAEGDTSPFLDWLRAGVLAAGGRFDEALESLGRVDTLTDALQLQQRDTVLIAARMEMLVGAGRLDEALADLLLLMAGRGVVTGYGPILLGLWGERPLDVLGQLVTEVGPANAGAVAEELRGAGDRGRQVADLLTTNHGNAR